MDASTASMRPTMFTAFPLKQAGGAAQRPDPVAAQIAAGLVGPGLHEFVGLIPLDGLVLAGVTAPQARVSAEEVDVGQREPAVLTSQLLGEREGVMPAPRLVHTDNDVLNNALLLAVWSGLTRRVAQRARGDGHLEPLHRRRPARPSGSGR